MANDIPKKPRKNHPWRNTASAKAVKWAREKSKLPDIVTVKTARPNYLRTHDHRLGVQK